MKIRNRPLEVRTHFRFRNLVQTEGIAIVLSRLLPTWPRLNLGIALHALRLWGPEARFNRANHDSPFNNRIFTGRELLCLFLDDHWYRKFLVNNEPILTDDLHGIKVRQRATEGGFEGEIAHSGALLAVCGELGLASNFFVRTRTREAYLKELITSAAASFVVTEELEWLLEVIARYIEFDYQPTWQNRWGREVSLQAGVDVLLSQSYNKGACVGGHVPYCFTQLISLNQLAPILRKDQVLSMITRLQATFDRLVSTQDASGAFTPSWTEQSDPSSSSIPSGTTELFDVTGHHLEWIAYAPLEVLLDSESISRACRFLTTGIAEVDDFTIAFNYGSFSHSASALLALAGIESRGAWRLLN